MERVIYSFAVQERVLRSLIFREAKVRFGKHGGGLLGELFNISLGIGFFVMLRYILGGPKVHRGMEMIPFIALGMCTYQLMRTTMGDVARSPDSARALVVFPQVTQLDVAIARTLVMTGIYLLFALILFPTLVWFGVSSPIENLPLVLFLMSIGGFLGFCLGLSQIIIVAKVPLMRSVINFGMRIMMFISGVFYVFPEVPRFLQGIVIYNPVMHVNDLLRDAYFASYTSEQADPEYVFFWAVGLLTFGLVCERVSRRRI